MSKNYLSMDLENYLSTAEACLSKIDKRLHEFGSLDYISLQKFKNIIECLPGNENAQEFEGELLRLVENVLFKKSMRSSRSTQQKMFVIIELFLIIKAEYEDTLEQKSSKIEKVFLTVCAFSFTMLMFAP